MKLNMMIAIEICVDEECEIFPAPPHTYEPLRVQLGKW